jgi:hypothetical protein
MISHRSVGDGRNTTRGDGDEEARIESCSEKKTCNPR